MDKILVWLHNNKFIDLYLLNNPHLDMWTEIDDVYNDERQWDKNAINTISNQLINEKTLLDIGCGGGQKTVSLSKGMRTVATDISHTGVKRTIEKGMKEGIEISGVRCSGDKLPFKESSFDYAMCNEVIEHIIDDKAVLKESNRVIKQDGSVIIGFPNIHDPRNFILDFGYLVIRGLLFRVLRISPMSSFRGHVHTYSKNSFVALLKEQGLKAEVCIPVYSPYNDSWMHGYFKRFPTRDINIFLERLTMFALKMSKELLIYTYVAVIKKRGASCA